jgi:predicted DNA-binding ribbon-helix-helix protein
MLRTNIFIEERQHQQIKEMAERENQNFSSMLREILDEGVRARKRRQLEKAAEIMASEYTTDKELTAFMALDGEDFLE